MDAFTQFEKDAWETTSKVYCDYFDRLTASCSHVFQNRFPDDKNAVILDCACGSGTALKQYRESHRQVIGLDFSQSMLQIAANNCPDTPLFQADVNALPIESESVDVLTMAFGLLHLAYPKSALQEFYRVCKQNGSIHLSVWQKPEHTSGFSLIIDAVKASNAAAPRLPDGPDFFKFSTINYTVGVLKEIGFSTVTAEKIPLEWKLPSVEAFFLAFKDGTARTGALLRSQPESVLRAIKKHLTDNMQTYRREEGYVIPMPAIVFHAARL